MTPVTQLENGPLFRFATSVKRGDVLTISFIIEGEAGLVGHAWRAQMRKSGNRIASGFGVTVATTTVTTANDSLRVTLVINAAGTALLKPATYVADCEDVTAGKTWASGTVQVLQDWSN